jgi:hypothetical protein
MFILDQHSLLLEDAGFATRYVAEGCPVQTRDEVADPLTTLFSLLATKSGTTAAIFVAVKRKTFSS